MTTTLIDLLEESRQRGFLGPGPVEAHLDHARAFSVAVESAPSRAIDLGAGGGLPGLVLAEACWPETRWVLLDAHERRTAFLEEAVEVLGLGNRVQVVRERAEVVGRELRMRGGFDLVVARSFGPPAVTAECAAPLLVAGGMLVVSEPPTAATADRWPDEGLAGLGLAPAAAMVVGGSPPVHLACMAQIDGCDDRYPRRTGIPAKRPLF